MIKKNVLLLLLIGTLSLSVCTSIFTNEKENDLGTDNSKPVSEKPGLEELEEETEVKWQKVIVTPSEIMGTNFENTFDDNENTNKFQLELIIPSSWKQNETEFMDNERRLEGLGSLYKITDDLSLIKTLKIYMVVGVL